MQIKYNDKLRQDQKAALTGYYNSQHPKIIHKTTKQTVEPETPKEHAHLHDIMTHKEVAEYLSISPLTLKRWSLKGRVKCIRINSRGDRRYLRSEINKLLEGKV